MNSSDDVQNPKCRFMISEPMAHNSFEIPNKNSNHNNVTIFPLNNFVQLFLDIKHQIKENYPSSNPG